MLLFRLPLNLTPHLLILKLRYFLGLLLLLLLCHLSPLQGAVLSDTVDVAFQIALKLDTSLLDSLTSVFPSVITSSTTVTPKPAPRVSFSGGKKCYKCGSSIHLVDKFPTSYKNQTLLLVDYENVSATHVQQVSGLAEADMSQFTCASLTCTL